MKKQKQGAKQNLLSGMSRLAISVKSTNTTVVTRLRNAGEWELSAVRAIIPSCMKQYVIKRYFSSTVYVKGPLPKAFPNGMGGTNQWKQTTSRGSHVRRTRLTASHSNVSTLRRQGKMHSGKLTAAVSTYRTFTTSDKTLPSRLSRMSPWTPLPAKAR